MTMTNELLLTHEMLAPMEAVLTGTGYRVHRLWEQADRLAFLAGPGQTIGAMVHAGEFKLDISLMSEMPRLGLIACVSVGYDGVDVDWCRSRGIAVTHSTGLNAEDVADHAVGLLISAWRGLVEGDRRLRAGQWTHSDRMRPRPSLRGKTAGIVGLGHIGEATARRLEAFGMQIAWWGPRPKDSRWRRAESLIDLARESDALMVCARGDAAGLISAEVIAAVGPKGCIVNIARGQVVDEDGLISALRDGSLGMAGLDVFAQEPTPPARWEGVPNTVLTPHTAGGTLESIPQMIAMTLENLRLYFAGEPLATPVGGIQ
ncbi:MAG: 2-hydroxyacid dehydrogenase [Caulobacter sp.]|nr:2-hydroxyacid dehydrogenase [Caulobacter sp.]